MAELHRAVPWWRRRSNRFWYRAAALSFTLKLAIVVLLFLALRATL